jgi:hypothetical protein
MTRFKIWPIGLQSGPTGRPTGIGEMINELTNAGIAMFSAASDSTSIIYDLQEARRRSGVPHTGNFIPTGYVNDYHLRVPEYRSAHSPQLAIRHWNAVEKKASPKRSIGTVRFPVTQVMPTSSAGRLSKLAKKPSNVAIVGPPLASPAAIPNPASGSPQV